MVNSVVILAYPINMYSVIYSLLFIFGISWAIKFPGSCPDPELSPARLPENFTIEEINTSESEFTFHPLLGIPFSEKKSHFFLDINVNTYNFFSLRYYIHDSKHFRLFLSTERFYYANIPQPKQNIDQNFVIDTEVHLYSDLSKPTDCNSSDQVRLEYEKLFLMFWSCKNGELFYDEAFLVIELKKVGDDKLEEYKNRLFNLKPIAKKYISPQLMEYIDWEPEETAAVLPAAPNCNIVPHNITFGLPPQISPLEEPQLVTPNVEFSLPSQIIVVSVVVLIIIGTLLVLKKSNAIHPTTN